LIGKKIYMDGGNGNIDLAGERGFSLILMLAAQ